MPFGLGIFDAVKIGAVLLLVGSFAWIVDDYAYQRNRAENLEAKVAAYDEAVNKLNRAHAIELEQARADTEAVAAVAERRAADLADLADDLAAIREAPDNDCAVHPAILRSLDLLRVLDGTE